MSLGVIFAAAILAAAHGAKHAPSGALQAARSEDAKQRAPAPARILEPGPEEAPAGEQPPAPAVDLALHAPDLAAVRDKVVAWFENEVTHMNASSVLASDALVVQVVAAMQNATWVELANAGALRANASGARPLGPIEVAQVQGALVNHLNFEIGHMNGSSVVGGVALVRELLGCVADKTAIPPEALALLGGRPPREAEAEANEPAAEQAEREGGANGTSAGDEAALPLLEREGGRGSGGALAFVLVSVGAVSLAALAATGRVRAPSGAAGLFEAEEGVQLAGGDELSASSYARYEGGADGALLAGRA